MDEECSVKRSSVICQEWNVRGLLQDLLHCVTMLLYSQGRLLACATAKQDAKLLGKKEQTQK